LDRLLHIRERVFCLRGASNADRDGIVRLVKTILPEFGEVYDERTSESDLPDIEKTYLESGGAFEVLVDAGQQIVGTVGIVPVGDGPFSTGCCKMRKMYIDPGCRNLGLGKLLVGHILEKARSLDFRQIILETITSMQAAISLYEKAGFTRIEGHAASPRCDIVMEKKL
jgi:ribosomal protein S18 acetylase RimI-like enzyme